MHSTKVFSPSLLDIVFYERILGGFYELLWLEGPLSSVKLFYSRLFNPFVFSLWWRCFKINAFVFMKENSDDFPP